MTRNENNNNEYVIIVFIVILLLVMLSILWWVASPLVGRIYAIIRLIETGGIWSATDWGHYFLNNVGKRLSFLSIYQSSMAFNIAFAFLIIVIGFFAYKTVSTKNLKSQIYHDKPLGYRQVMERQALNFPHNQFFLDHNMFDYPVDRGVARMPKSALEVLEDCNAIEGIYVGDTLSDPTAKTGFCVDETKIVDFFSSTFGPKNPFSETNFPFRNTDRVIEAVNKIPWHLVSIIYACTYRLYALDSLPTDDYEKANNDIDQFFKDIWSEFNAGKKQLKSRLVLGFIDENDRNRRYEIAKKQFPNEKKLKVQTLQEWCDEIVDVQEKKTRADLFKTTVKARSELIRILTEVYDVQPDRLTPISNQKGKHLHFNELNSFQKTQYNDILKKQKLALDEIHRLYQKNGYLFGLCASLLQDARSGGILPPAFFSWMRFYDRIMWSFLRVVGMNTPVPEVAGMFDHFLIEKKLGSPLSKPYFVNSINGLVNEANKYITDDLRQKYKTIKSTKTVREKTLKGIKLLNAVGNYFLKRR